MNPPYDFLAGKGCVVSMFTVDPKAEAALTPEGRLQRPWKVFIIGATMSLGIVSIMCHQLRSYGLLNERGIRSVIAFAVWGLLMSSAYAYVGVRYGKARADRVVGWAGLIVAFAGTALVLWTLVPRP